MFYAYQILPDEFTPKFTSYGFELSYPVLSYENVLKDKLSHLASLTRMDLVSLWHYRLNHAISDSLRILIASGQIDGL